MKELKASLNVAKQLSKGVVSAGSVDLFQEVSNRIAEADLEFDDTQKLYDATIREWEELAKAFAKDTKTTKPEQFFALIDEFAEQWTKSIEGRKSRIEKELKEKKKAEAQDDIRKKKIELAQRQAALKAKKSTEGKKTEEDVKAEAQLGDMLSKLTSSNSVRRLERGAIRQQRRGSNAGQKKPTGLNVRLAPPVCAPLSG